MIQSKKLFYFGKLRRRREFIKSSGLPSEFYTLWEGWFNKCSRKNSFLPFLENRNNNDKPIWLFILNEATGYKLGLTVLSNDMSEREYPFVVYYDLSKLNVSDSDVIKDEIFFLIKRANKFKKIISIGDFSIEDLGVFESDKDNNEINPNLSDLIADYSMEFDNEKPNNQLSSFWINLNTSSITQHDGAFTCTLYNKIYG